MENIIFIGVTIFCGLIFIGFGLFALKKQTPIHFWSGTVVKPEEITDVKAYNKANAIMWITYGAIIGLSGFLITVVKKDIFAVVYVVVMFLGLILMMVLYGKIKEKYRVK